MTTVRLGKKIEQLLEEFSTLKGKSKSELIKEALLEYIEAHFISNNPFEMGKDLFGKYGSGKTDNSITYKRKIKEKINEKYTH
ncbi:MAG: CopG family transcriptional regulator [Spirochaetales bacterium]|nr:CopG family transcriptional regulator [Spirochaetales bacterium]